MTNIRSLDINWDDEDFHCYTAGRWLYNEQKQLADRYVQFNMKELVRAAARSQGHDITACVGVEKLPEGDFNKTFLITMRDGLQVIAKVPNPNAGLPFYTTASEVATMEFVRMDSLIHIVRFKYTDLPFLRRGQSSACRSQRYTLGTPM